MLAYRSRQIPMQSVQDVLGSLDDAAVACITGSATVVHAGMAASITATGESRIEELRGQVQDIAWELDGPDLGAPIWLAGIGFAAGDDWPGFPDAHAALPLRQWRWVDESLYLTELVDGEGVAAPAGGAIEATMIDAERWHGMVAAVIEAIHAGDLTKVVLARSSRTPGSDAVASFCRLRGLDEGTGFLFRRGDATFFGCTPETLVRLHDGEVETHALAGTARTAEAEHLTGADKDILEHELVAAFVRERLVESGIRQIQQAPRRRLALRHVTHLETPIRGRAPEGTHLLDIAAQLHPTPAVCGTPRQRSLELLRRLEDVPRGWYAGAVGWFDARGQGELNVALRCAHEAGGVRTMFAGAGIVAGSQPDKEWRETEDKLATMREAA